MFSIPAWTPKGSFQSISHPWPTLTGAFWETKQWSFHVCLGLYMYGSMGIVIISAAVVTEHHDWMIILYLQVAFLFFSNTHESKIVPHIKLKQKYWDSLASSHLWKGNLFQLNASVDGPQETRTVFLLPAPAVSESVFIKITHCTAWTPPSLLFNKHCLKLV